MFFFSDTPHSLRSAFSEIEAVAGSQKCQSFNEQKWNGRQQEVKASDCKSMPLRYKKHMSHFFVIVHECVLKQWRKNIAIYNPHRGFFFFFIVHTLTDLTCGNGARNAFFIAYSTYAVCSKLLFTTYFSPYLIAKWQWGSFKSENIVM